MGGVEKLTKYKVLDWLEISAWVTTDITTRLQASSEFMNAERFRQQCWHACQVHWEDPGNRQEDSQIPQQALGAALGRNGRLSILGDEHREDLVRQIETADRDGIPWTITEILQFFQARAAEAVDKNRVYHWLHREPRIKSCRGVPMEDRRLEITPEVIVDYFHQAIDMTDGLPAHFPSDAAEM
jgi:hypothetical protein